MALATTGGDSADLRLVASIDLSAVIRDLEGLTQRQFTVDVGADTSRMMEQMAQSMRTMTVDVQASESSTEQFGDDIGDAVNRGISRGLETIRDSVVDFVLDTATSAFRAQPVIQEAVARITQASGGSTQQANRNVNRLIQLSSQAGISFQENAGTIGSLFNVLSATGISEEDVFRRLSQTLQAGRAIVGATGNPGLFIQAAERIITSNRAGRQELNPLLLRGVTLQEVAEAAGLSIEELQANLRRGNLIQGIAGGDSGEIAARLQFNDLTTGGTVTTAEEFQERLIEVLARRADDIQGNLPTALNRLQNEASALVRTLDMLTGISRGLGTAIETLAGFFASANRFLTTLNSALDGFIASLQRIVNIINPLTDVEGQPNTLVRTGQSILEYFGINSAEASQMAQETVELTMQMNEATDEATSCLGNFSRALESASERLERLGVGNLGSGGLLTEVDTLGNVLSSESQIN